MQHKMVPCGAGINNPKMLKVLPKFKSKVSFLSPCFPYCQVCLEATEIICPILIHKQMLWDYLLRINDEFLYDVSSIMQTLHWNKNNKNLRWPT